MPRSYKSDVRRKRFTGSPKILDKIRRRMEKLLEEDGKYYEVSFHVYSHKENAKSLLVRRYRVSDDYPELAVLKAKEIKQLMTLAYPEDTRPYARRTITKYLREYTHKVYNSYGLYGRLDPLMERLSWIAIDYMNTFKKFKRSDIKWMRPLVFEYTSKYAYGYDNRLAPNTIRKHFLKYGIIDPKLNITDERAIKRQRKDIEYVVDPSKKRGYKLINR